MVHISSSSSSGGNCSYRSINNSSNKTLASMLSYVVITAFIASSILSVDAIMCHQCNSHLDEDCIALRLSTPRALRDNQYLKECEGDHSANAFCRKTVTTIEVTGEHRIVRACGWHRQDLEGRNDTCFDSDNEGFVETICACFTDGCNAAPSTRSHNQLTVVGLAFVAVLMAVFYRQSC